MKVENIRVQGRTRNPWCLPHGGMQHNAESYYYMLERNGPDPCVVFDVTVIKGEKKPLAPEKFVHEFMAKNYPDMEYHLERHIQAFDGMLDAFEQYGRAFVYYYCYISSSPIADAWEASDKLERFVRSKPFMTKIEKHMAEVD